MAALSVLCSEMSAWDSDFEGISVVELGVSLRTLPLSEGSRVDCNNSVSTSSVIRLRLSSGISNVLCVWGAEVDKDSSSTLSERPSFVKGSSVVTISGSKVNLVSVCDAEPLANVEIVVAFVSLLLTLLDSIALASEDDDGGRSGVDVMVSLVVGKVCSWLESTDSEVVSISVVSVSCEGTTFNDGVLVDKSSSDKASVVVDCVCTLVSQFSPWDVLPEYASTKVVVSDSSLGEEEVVSSSIFSGVDSEVVSCIVSVALNSSVVVGRAVVEELVVAVLEVLEDGTVVVVVLVLSVAIVVLDEEVLLEASLGSSSPHTTVDMS